MKSILTTIFLLTIAFSNAQTTITGIVTDPSGNPIPGANIYLEGTYDGASSADDGTFTFTTSETGEQMLVVSFLSFETYVFSNSVNKMKDLKIVLREDVNSLGSVILNAGTFSAGDNSKASVLTPLDIVTTAGAAGDYIGAFQTLPGTSTVAEDGRLFVRGGDANEANVYIDGLRVFQPFSATANNIPTRGRFSPFLFKGTNFSTGGYSAEYGDALSSVLLLNTINEPEQEKTDLSFITVGLGVGNTQKWEKNSLSINAFYLNLKPYQEIISQRVDWIKPFESLSGEAVYRHHFDNGLFKLYGGLNYSDFQLIQEDINVSEGISFGLTNRNLYLNASYKGDLKNDWSLATGVSFSNDHNDIKIEETNIDNDDNSAHIKVKLRKRFSNRFKLSFGAEQFLGDFKEDINATSFGNFQSSFKNNSTAAFSEANIFFNKKLAMQVGVRATHNTLLDFTKVSPRASLAYKIAEKSQVSLAYGDFYQSPQQDILKYNSSLDPEKSSHYILNYLYQNDGRTLRAEAYYKNYNSLVKFNTELPEFDSFYNNNGDGYATGLDIYWRDNKSIKNFEYWTSYSYLDTKRNYRNYPERATPNFAAKHNLSVVGKYWAEDWKSLISATYNFASGRPYTDPNTTDFLGKKTKTFNSLNMSWAYLISQQKILFVSVSNVLGFDNVFNYQYTNAPNVNGDFARRAIRPTADRFFIVGFFWTISDNKKDNQLNNL
ncbi:Outer membrane cobalamin receptor protein [Aquimarina amphilecti]|uniref:Outer membrane cobalamin receptor protein n=1 Tax=Aquimarina amphilecti TaxID=1038014 RepID=A0A1H7Q0Z6_AQUAM|nr:TonB-dependent receptor [Aquimarina amphilecti]SEL41155.1 Outer membrane cobalamin receptor protein [Aquimarina amphilecti]